MGDGHVHVFAVKASLDRIGGQGGHPGQSVQDDLSVAEENALGLAGGSGGVECGGPSVFVEIRKIRQGDTAGQQCFVFSVQTQRSLKSLRLIRKENDPPDCPQTVPDLFQQGQKVGTDQDYLILGISDGVSHPLG